MADVLKAHFTFVNVMCFFFFFFFFGGGGVQNELKDKECMDFKSIIQSLTLMNVFMG